MDRRWNAGDERDSSKLQWVPVEPSRASRVVPLQMIFPFHLGTASRIVLVSDSTGAWQRDLPVPPPPPASERALVQAIASLPGDVSLDT